MRHKSLLVVLVIAIVLTSGCARRPGMRRVAPPSSTVLTSSTVPTTITKGAENHPFGFAGPTQPPDNFTKLKEVGADYVREATVWGGTGKLDFSKMDAAYDKLRDDYGLKLVVRLKLRGENVRCDTSLSCPDAPIYETCPASSADCPPKDLGEWGEKGYSPSLYDDVYRVLEHLFGTNRPVEYIVVGNEVNTLLFWHATFEEYQKTRGTVYKAVHDFDSINGEDVKVVDNGFAGAVWGAALIRDAYCNNDKSIIQDPVEFTGRYVRRRFTLPAKEILSKINCENPDRSQKIMRESFRVDENIGGPSFDIMAYHFYEPWDTQEEIIRWIKAEMRKNGYQKPIMHTEGGYSDNLRLLDNPPVADKVRRDVANDIPKLHVVAFANGVKTWLWLPFTERYESDYYGPQYSGLVSPEFKELPAFTSYKVMAEKLDGFTSVEKLNVGEYSYRFTVNDKPVYVLWSKNPIAVDLSAEIQGDVKVTRVDGSVEIRPSSSLQVSESPIFVERV